MIKAEDSDEDKNYHADFNAGVYKYDGADVYCQRLQIQPSQLSWFEHLRFGKSHLHKGKKFCLSFICKQPTVHS